MRLRWTRRSLKAVDEIARYIARERPTAAWTIVQRIREVADHLAQQPWLGRPGRVAGTRELIVSRTPFLIAYRIRNEAVEILDVLHAARRWPPTF